MCESLVTAWKKQHPAPEDGEIAVTKLTKQLCGKAVDDPAQDRRLHAQFHDELKHEFAINDELEALHDTMRTARLQEIHWMSKMSKCHRLLYRINQLNTKTPRPLPGKWSETMVWAFAITYVAVSGAFVVSFCLMRGQDITVSWFASIAIELVAEVFIAIPLQIFVLNTLIPRYMGPVVLKMQEHCAKDLGHDNVEDHVEYAYTTCLREQISKMLGRDQDLRFDAAQVMCRSFKLKGAALTAPDMGDAIRAYFGVNGDRWRDALGCPLHTELKDRMGKRISVEAWM